MIFDYYPWIIWISFARGSSPLLQVFHGPFRTAVVERGRRSGEFQGGGGLLLLQVCAHDEAGGRLHPRHLPRHPGTQFKRIFFFA